MFVHVFHREPGQFSHPRIPDDWTDPDIHILDTHHCVRWILGWGKKLPWLEK